MIKLFGWIFYVDFWVESKVFTLAEILMVCDTESTGFDVTFVFCVTNDDEVYVRILACSVCEKIITPATKVKNFISSF